MVSLDVPPSPIFVVVVVVVVVLVLVLVLVLVAVVFPSPKAPARCSTTTLSSWCRSHEAKNNPKTKLRKKKRTQRFLAGNG